MSLSQKPSQQIAMIAREARRPGQVNLLPDIRHVIEALDTMHADMVALASRIMELERRLRKGECE